MLNYALRKQLVHQNVAVLVSEDLPHARKPDSIALTEEQLRILIACAQTSKFFAYIERHKTRSANSSEAAYLDEDIVFAAPDGLPVVPWTFTASFRHLVKRANVPYIRLHDLRDTHASLLGKHGVPIEVVSKRLGHATIAITAERYMRVYQERDAQAAEALERHAS